MNLFPPPSCVPFWAQLTRLQELCGHPLVPLDETVSTNSDALTLGRNGAAAGTLVIARRQTGGRGRLGKRWISHPDGGLFFSVLLRPDLDPADLPKITLAAGVALCRAISRICGLKPTIKWPNDLLINGRKCGGILAEAEFLDNGVLVVLGIGLNVATPATAFPAELREKTTALNRHDPTVTDRQLFLLAAILEEIDGVIATMEEGGFAAILGQWRALDYTLGRQLTWLTTAGETVRGISLGPDADGRLHIKDDQGRIHEVLSGDIRLQSP